MPGLGQAQLAGRAVEQAHGEARFQFAGSAADTDDGARPSSRAAAEKLPASTTRAKMRMPVTVSHDLSLRFLHRYFSYFSRFITKIVIPTFRCDTSATKGTPHAIDPTDPPL